MQGFLRLKKAAEVRGQSYQAGAVLEVPADIARELIASGAAVPAPGPGRRALHSDTFAADDLRITR